MVDWMPQKELLGHPQTKVFVTHGGSNGAQEAIYHGIPVLGIPLFFDQYDNLLHLQERGAGKTLQLGDVNGKSLNRVLRKCSPRQLQAEHAETVPSAQGSANITHGTHHLMVGVRDA
ncbi:hypothetical protein LDENG_00128240 [Lucifuga dentata]|nr:hypothetical protein LDENG_00128240 [Lucifuga dentata]